MNLKQKILAAGLAAIIGGAGIFGANTAQATAISMPSNDAVIAQMMQMIESLKQQIAQIIALIAQLKPLETCGNGICRFGETAATCAADCGRKECNANLARESCIAAGGNYSAVAGGCLIIEGQATSCGGATCNCPAKCGNSACETGENMENCLADCAFKLFPNIESFDLTKKTFTAKEIVKGLNAEKIATDNNTKYCVRAAIGSDKYPIMEQHDFQWLYSTIKNWTGVKMNFWIKGIKQSDGSILASEISLLTQ